jgi:hypothetical protein
VEEENPNADRRDGLLRKRIKIERVNAVCNNDVTNKMRT